MRHHPYMSKANDDSKRHTLTFLVVRTHHADSQTTNWEKRKQYLNFPRSEWLTNNKCGV